jgi:hypothetical protein
VTDIIYHFLKNSLIKVKRLGVLLPTDFARYIQTFKMPVNQTAIMQVIAGKEQNIFIG